ncbi:hypothetical protein Pcinc_020742, partial [Petrolisthes cinctipes]
MMSDRKATSTKQDYCPFDVTEDYNYNKRKNETTWGEKVEEEGKSSRCLATVLRSLCCCWSVHPQYPLLPSSVITHRKISRVVSNESLAKETVEEVVLLERSVHHIPTTQHSQQQTRTPNRHNSCNSSTPLTTTKDNSHSSNGSLSSCPEN